MGSDGDGTCGKGFDIGGGGEGGGGGGEGGNGGCDVKDLQSKHYHYHHLHVSHYLLEVLNLNIFSSVIHCINWQSS